VKLLSHDNIKLLIGSDLSLLFKTIIVQWDELILLILKYISIPLLYFHSLVDLIISEKDSIEQLSNDMSKIIDQYEDKISNYEDNILNLESRQLDLESQLKSLEEELISKDHDCSMSKALLDIEKDKFYLNEIANLKNELGYWKGVSEGQTKVSNSLSNVHWTVHYITFAYELYTNYFKRSNSGSFTESDRNIINEINSHILRSSTSNTPNSTQHTSSQSRGNVS
jgi:hypothetical protein